MQTNDNFLAVDMTYSKLIEDNKKIYDVFELSKIIDFNKAELQADLDEFLQAIMLRCLIRINKFNSENLSVISKISNSGKNFLELKYDLLLNPPASVKTEIEKSAFVKITKPPIILSYAKVLDKKTSLNLTEQTKTTIIELLIYFNLGLNDKKAELDLLKQDLACII